MAFETGPPGDSVTTPDNAALVGMGTGNGSPDQDWECDLPPVGTSYEVVLDLASRGGTLAVHFTPGPFYYYGSSYPPLASFSWSAEEVR